MCFPPAKTPASKCQRIFLEGRAKLSLAPYLKVWGGHATESFKMDGRLLVGCCVLGERGIGLSACKVDWTGHDISIALTQVITGYNSVVGSLQKFRDRDLTAGHSSRHHPLVPTARKATCPIPGLIGSHTTHARIRRAAYPTLRSSTLVKRATGTGCFGLIALSATREPEAALRALLVAAVLCYSLRVWIIQWLVVYMRVTAHANKRRVYVLDCAE